jgi:4-hydroxybenzoate polyprenyltransferase
VTAARPSRAILYLRLGRVSNLPTVWSNVIAGSALAGAAAAPARIAAVAAAISAFYVGGMFLNDAFDREIDARERPQRPIPAGLIGAREVFSVGFGLLAVGLVALALMAWAWRGSFASVASGAALAAAIVLYDAWHKNNALSPVLMGICRMLVYATAALATAGTLARPVIAGAFVLLAYLIGLTYVAKQETRSKFRRFWPLVFLAAPLVYAPLSGHAGLFVVVLLCSLATWIAWALTLLRSGAKGSIGGAVVALIAGIALVDALLVAARGQPTAAAWAALAFPATLFLQRFVSGT